MSIANLFDLSGKGTSSYYSSANPTGGTIRERLGEGLFTDEQKRLNQYADQDIQQVSAQNHRRLDKIKAEAVDMSEGDLVAVTGSGRNRNARTTAEDGVALANSVQFRTLGGGPAGSLKA